MIPLGIFGNEKHLLSPEIQAELARDFEIHRFDSWQSYDPATLLDKLRSVEIVLAGHGAPKLPMELCQDFGRLRYLCLLCGSIRAFVPKTLLKAGLRVTNWGDAVDSVAEGAVALILAMLKQVVTLNDFARTGKDQRICQTFPCTLRGRDVGLYGFGPIGRHAARMLQGFGPKIAVYDPHAKDLPEGIRRCATLRELFSTCQIVSIHCGLNDATRNSVTRDLLELLPQGGILVNTARGDIVDEAALGELVRAGKLLCALDVIHNEAKWDWAGSPVAASPGAVLTRHGISGGKGYPPGQAPRPRLPEYAVFNLAAYRQGRPLRNLITAEIYDLKT